MGVEVTVEAVVMSVSAKASKFDEENRILPELYSNSMFLALCLFLMLLAIACICA
jgi:hypothetical protein